MERRPAFNRADTDDIRLESISATSAPGSAPNKTKAAASINVVEDQASSSSSAAKPDDHSPDQDDGYQSDRVVTNAQDIVTTVLDVEDDPSINPWTFRMFFLGIGLSVFGSVLQEIFYFKPQTIFVSGVFLTVIAYILGEAMAVLIPRKGRIGRFLNPGPFNLKEHASISLMASAGAQSAQSTQALAAQQLFYGGYPSVAAGIFITLSTQLIGFGLAGMMREILVWPTRMYWPYNLPSSSLLESLHKDKKVAKQKVKIFYILFAIIFVWQLFPEYIFDVLVGVSVFCLAKQDSLVFTNLFGGAQGNEGLGFLSLCFDWQYISAFISPLWFPLDTLVNAMVGYFICICLFMGLYYGNIWNAQSFPFMSQYLFDSTSNSTSYVLYNTTGILDDHNRIDPTKLAEKGAPNLTATYLGYLITSNIGFTGLLVHQFLFNLDDIKAGWTWVNRENLHRVMQPGFWRFWDNDDMLAADAQRRLADPKIDPHYKLMLRKGYKEAPQWWYAAVFVISAIVGLVCLYEIDSSLDWWAYIIALILLTVMMLFFAAIFGTNGFQFNVQPICQLLAGYICPNRPIANMYFSCYTFQALQQGEVLLRDLKLGQYVHLSPRCTFTVQMIGCFVGAMFNFLIMDTIVKNQEDALKSIEASNIWSGQQVQQLNTLGIAFSVSKDLFNVGQKYQWVTLSLLLGFLAPLPFYALWRFTGNKFFKYWNVAIIMWYAGTLFVGINTSYTMFFGLGLFAQFYLRRYQPRLFNKYNYISSAALDGGTQTLAFILTFAVFGGSGVAHPFPTWAGNPSNPDRNIDYCMKNPALGDS